MSNFSDGGNVFYAICFAGWEVGIIYVQLRCTFFGIGIAIGIGIEIEHEFAASDSDSDPDSDCD